MNEKVAEKNRYQRPLTLGGGEGRRLDAASLSIAPKVNADRGGEEAADADAAADSNDDVVIIDGNRVFTAGSNTDDVDATGGGKKQPAVAVGDIAATVSVEELALAHYASAAGGGWRGVHSEGTAWTTLFGLLFADILLTCPPGVPKRDVFRSDFQSAPLDLDADLFLPRRHRAVSARLEEIHGEPGAASRLLTGAWMTHYGSALRGVSWTLLTLRDLRDVAEGLGGAALANVCALMAEDYGGWSGGAPDLLLWRPAAFSPAPASAQALSSFSREILSEIHAEAAAAKAVEVKSRNDTLSDQQRAWLLALRDAGVTVALCKVE